MRNFYRIIFILWFLIFLFSPAKAQESTIKSFFKLPRPEKCWVVFHPFKAKKAFNTSNLAKQKADSIKATTILDGDANGGQVDAFRHSFWMAVLSKNIGTKAAKKLGEKHEKSNYIFYKKNKNEDGTIPDNISSIMDLKNNDIGIRVYKNNTEKTYKEIELLIIKKIKQGEMYIIKKDKNGNFLDCKGNIISAQELKGKWENNKCLVFSDGRKIGILLNK